MYELIHLIHCVCVCVCARACVHGFKRERGGGGGRRVREYELIPLIALRALLSPVV